MDKTHIFKAGVMTAKLQRKDEICLQVLGKRRLKAATAECDEFVKQSKEVCQNITILRNVLTENRQAYMRIGQHLRRAGHMTDEQRNLIDRETENFLAYYTQHLAQVRSDCKSTPRKPQQHQHMEAVLELLGNYLRTVKQIHAVQKKYRIQHELETYRLLKLSAKKKYILRPAVEHRGSRVDVVPLVSNEVLNGPGESSATDLDKDCQTAEVSTPNCLRHRFKSNTSAEANSQKVALDDDIQRSQQLVDEETDVAKELSPEDMQIFEEENVQLYNELQCLSDEVEQIEKNVVDIAQLQDIFTEKVSIQQHNIERIAYAVVGATENVKDANEQIKEAIQRNASLRLWSLFFLLVMSFALLFLDWYYD